MSYDEGRSTFIRKFQFKSFSNSLIVRFLFFSFDKQYINFFKNYLNFILLNSAKNLLYAEFLEEASCDVPLLLLNQFSFQTETVFCNKKFLQIFHPNPSFFFLKKEDYAMIKMGKYAGKFAKIKKIENDFAHIYIQKNNETVFTRHFGEKEEEIIENTKINLDEKKLITMKINNLIFVARGSELSKNKKLRIKDKYQQKNSESQVQNMKELYERNLGSIYKHKHDSTIKLLIETKLGYKKLMSFEETIDRVENIKIEQIFKVKTSTLSKGKDVFGSIFFPEDRIKIISGKYRGHVGIVVFVQKKLLFLKCTTVDKNNGFLVINSDTCILMLKNQNNRNEDSRDENAATFLQKKKVRQNIQFIDSNAREKIEFEAITKGKLVNFSNNNISLKKYV